jgi:hypothetical protein
MPENGRPALCEFEYRRGGTLAYLAARDVHHANLFGRVEERTGIEPFGRLVEQVMMSEPYASAPRLLGRRQRLLARRQGLDRAARGALGEPALVSVERLRGAGGLPVGLSGRALVLLSGGLDSPVAAFRMMKRGQRCDFLHFSGRPFTGPESIYKAYARSSAGSTASRAARGCSSSRSARRSGEWRRRAPAACRCSPSGA